MIYKRKRALDINLIHAKELAELGLLKEYAMFLYLKSKYPNSCVYNYSQKRISEKFNLSRTAVKKYIKIFLDLKWCRMHCGNLVFNKLKNIDDNKQKILYNLEISESGKIKEILHSLRLKILHVIQGQFDTLKKLRYDLIHAQHTSVISKAKRLLKRIGVKESKLPEASDQLTISMNKFAKMFKCSIGTAHNIMTRYKKSGEVLCIAGFRKQFKRTRNPQLINAILDKIKGTYYYDGIIYKTECNKYQF